MKELIGLSAYCGDLNLSGLITIEYLPTTWIDKAAYQEKSIFWNRHVQEVPLLKGDWLKAPTLTGKRIWTEKLQRTKQGKYYDQVINARIPNLRPEVVDEFELMTDYEYLLRLQDRNGNYWIIGTLATPFTFYLDGTTGDGSAINEHRARFTTKTIHKSRGFVL